MIHGAQEVRRPRGRFGPKSATPLALLLLAGSLVLSCRPEDPGRAAEPSDPGSGFRPPAEGRYVIPAGSEKRLREALTPLLSEPPAGMSAKGVSVEKSVVEISMEILDREARLILHHPEQKPRAPAARSRHFRKENFFAEAICPGCAEEQWATFDLALKELESGAWDGIWHDPASASARRPAGDALPREELRLRPGGGWPALAPVAALLVVLLLSIDARRRGLPRLGPEHVTEGGCHGLPAGGALRWYDVATVSALAIVIAWPLLWEPFDDAAAVQRIWHVSTSVTTDPGHPFLTFLILRPFAAISLEPPLIRLPLLGFFLAQVALLCVASAKVGGRWAGILAGVLLACEARRRHGFLDVAGWDLAGAFTIGLLLWLLWLEQRPPGKSHRAWIILCLLLVLGLYSSWLYLVPAGAAVLCVGLLALERRANPWWTAGVFLLFGLMALRVGWVFVSFESPPTQTTESVVLGLYRESPLGRAPWLVVPLAVGLIFCCARPRRVSSIYPVLSVALVALAVVISSSQKQQAAYYIDLVTGLALHIAAVGAVVTAAGLSRMAGRIVSRLGAGAADSLLQRSSRLTALGVMAALGLLTFHAGAGDIRRDTRGFENIHAFYLKAKESRSPIVTDHGNLDDILAYELARRGATFESLKPPAGSPLFLSLDRRSCRAGGVRGSEEKIPAPVESARTLFVLIDRRGGGHCYDALVERCRRLFEETAAHNFFACPTKVLISTEDGAEAR